MRNRLKAVLAVLAFGVCYVAGVIRSAEKVAAERDAAQAQRAAMLERAGR